MTLKLWDGSISLHRDFVKSTKLRNVHDISCIINYVAYEFLDNKSILSNVGVTISQKDGKYVENNSRDVLYIQNISYYRYLVRRVLIFISDCFGYTIEEDECCALKQIMFVGTQNNHQKIDSISYIIVPSLLRIICYKLEIDDTCLFKHYFDVNDLLLQTVNKYEKNYYRISGVTIISDSTSQVTVRFYFKDNYANLILPWFNYKRYFSDTQFLIKHIDCSHKSLFYNLYHHYNLSFDCIIKLRLNKLM